MIQFARSYKTLHVKYFTFLLILLASLDVCIANNSAPQLPDTVVRNLDDYESMVHYFEYLDSFKEKTMLKRYPETPALILSAINWAKEKGSKQQVLLAKFYLMHFYSAKEQNIEVIKLANELLLDQTFQENPLVLNTLKSLKRAYLNTEQYMEILDMFPLYDVLSKKHNKRNTLSEFIDDYSLGMLHYSLKNYRKSIKYFTLHYESNNSLTTLNKSSTFNNIGLCFKNLNNKDSAIYFFNKAINTLQTGEMQEEHILGYGYYFQKVIEANKAEFYVEQKDYLKALPIFLEEYKLSKVYSEMNIEASSASKISNVFFLMNEIDSSISYAFKSIKAAGTKFNPYYLEKSFFILGKSYALKGDLKKADNYFDNYQNLKDSISAEKIKQHYLTSSIKYEISKTQSILKQSLHDIEIEKNRNQLQFVGLLTLAILALALFVSYKKTLNSKRVAEQQKMATQHALEQKEVLLKEVHHRVKNNLQVISSLLDIQVGKIQNFKFSNMVDEVKNHIHSMSVVHQMLYMTDDLTKIKLQNYLSELTSHIKNSRNKRDVTISIHAERMETSIEKAIPLGLISTELVVNSFKHAFNDGRKGEIRIDIHALNESEYLYTYTDNGPGIKDEDAIGLDHKLGFRLLLVLAEEMNSKLEIISNEHFEIQIKLSN
ncbi:MAG: histidine kinase dimerization/phosphoacceptor domain -containing protein [Bacteroidia bacterium]